MNEEQLYIDGKPTALCYEQAAKEIGGELIVIPGYGLPGWGAVTPWGEPYYREGDSSKDRTVIALGIGKDAPRFYWGRECWEPYYQNRWAPERTDEGMAAWDALVRHYTTHWPFEPTRYVVRLAGWTSEEIREAIREGEVPARKVRGRWWVCSKWAAEQIADAVDDDRDSLMYSY